MLHKRSQLLLICGLVLSLGVLTACSSPEAVQANAPVMSSEVTTADPNSGVSSSSSEIVSSSASSVSVNSGVTSSPSSGTNSTTLQAPSTSKPSGGTVSTKPASTVTKPASKPTSPASKPASKPTSTAPASKPTSTAPVDNGSFSAKYHGATYGCDDKSQYETVLDKAANVKGSGTYSSAYAKYQKHSSSFESLWGVAYSDTWNDIISIEACFGASGSGSASGGSAYDYFTGANSMCADKAKALEAALHCAGYNARLAAGTRAGSPHMWVQVYTDGAWYNIESAISTSTPAGYSLSSTGYNL